MAREIIMPKFGFTQETAEIVRWIKREGELVDVGDPIVEVTTDKVNMEVEAPARGVLSNVRYREGDVVPVTEVIAYIMSPEEAGGRLIGQSGINPDTMVSSTTLQRSEPKATPLAERVARVVGLPLDRIQGSGPNGRILRRDVENTLRQLSMNKVRTVPAARRLAREAGIDISKVKGSGPRYRVQSRDVQSYLATRSSLDVTFTTSEPINQPENVVSSLTITGDTKTQSGYRKLPLTGMRRTIARRLQRSAQEAPHIQLEVRVDVTEVEALRAKANRHHLGEQPKVSLTAIFVKSAAWALKRHPSLNAWLQSIGQEEQIVLVDEINIGIAVALEQGLIVPVIRQANEKGILQIAREIEDLSQRARANKLRPDEVVDGTFSISNLGMFGVERFSAIINPPQVAILAVGAVCREVVADENNEISVRPLVKLTLCVDHRVVDGAVAAAFLRDLKVVLEDPQVILL